MLSYECAQKLDSGLACAAPDDASFPSSPRDAGTQWRSSSCRKDTKMGFRACLRGAGMTDHSRRSRGSGNPVPFVTVSKCSQRHWIPAFAGMTDPFPIAATRCVARLATPGGSRSASFARTGIAMSRVGLKRRLAIPRRSPRYARGPSPGGSRRYILSIIAWPKPEQDTCFEPGIRRAKS
jgi:hypothetical protein